MKKGEEVRDLYLGPGIIGAYITANAEKLSPRTVWSNQGQCGEYVKCRPVCTE